jgi:hypothetical protein
VYLSLQMSNKSSYILNEKKNKLMFNQKNSNKKNVTHTFHVMWRELCVRCRASGNNEVLATRQCIHNGMLVNKMVNNVESQQSTKSNFHHLDLTCVLWFNTHNEPINLGVIEWPNVCHFCSVHRQRGCWNRDATHIGTKVLLNVSCYRYRAI